MKNLSIAESFKSRYESEDFVQDYFAVLCESFSNDRGDMINRIIDLFNVSNYETKKELSNWKAIDREQAKKIYEFIDANLWEFTTKFSGYYVGYTSLDSVEFGEQEEQLTGLYNKHTGKEYDLNYLRRSFRKADYCINRSSPNYAYYIVSGGLHVDLLKDKNSIELLNNFLITI